MKNRLSRRLARLAFTVIFLLATGLTAEAQTNYVFYNATYGFIYNYNGSVSVKLDFDESCIWIASGDLGNTSRNIYSYIDNTKYLRGSGSSPFISLGTTQQENWRGSNNCLRYRQSSSNNYFINYNGSFSVSTSNYSDGFTYYTVSITNAITPTLSISYPAEGAYVGNVNGTMTISANVSGNYRPKYYKFNNHYYLEDGTDYETAPSQVSNYTYTYELVGECANYATISGNTVTYTTDAGHDVVAQVKVTAKPQDYDDVIVGQETCSFVLRSATVAAPVITRIEGTNQYQITTSAQGASIKYTIDGTDIDEWASNGTTYSEPITVTTDGAVIKAKVVREGRVSEQTQYTVSDVILNPPTITFSNAGVVTITNPNTFASSATIHYTSDGSDPTSSSSEFSSYTASNMQTIKAIVTATGYVTSPVASKQYRIASGVSGGVVTLNDYEDHNWTYYSGVDASVDGGHYNNSYLGKLYSPNPRNVKITYLANGGAVSISEPETTFVYYKTIEKVDNAYKYQVISNPFSKRPAGKGFGGWKLKSITTEASISGHTTTTNETLALDEELTLTLPDAGINGTSAEIVFEATWVDANITYVTSNPTSNQTYSFSSGTYETNLIVLKPTNNSGAVTNYTRQITISGSATIMMVEPDGSADYRNRSFTSLIVPATGATNTTKIEWASWAPSGNIDARGRNLTIGRGVTTTGTDARALYGTNQTANTTNVVNQVLKIESGSYSSFNHFNNSGTNCITKQIVVFGCDYDRAKSDNEKLSITGQLIGANGSGAGNASGTHDANLFTNKSYMKSGTFMTGVTIAGAEWDHSYYLGINNAKNATGKRLFEMEGGYLANNIAGGMDISMNGTKNSDQYINVFIRIRGGHVLGSIYGGARFAESQGSRQIVLTGGEVNGWIAGGANGNEPTQGGTEGASYIYVGGNAKVDSKGDGTSIGSSIGGCIYGAGCGYGPESSSGEMGLGTNVVVADNAYVERGVYGGGAFGYCATDQTANIYITGGHVEGKSGNYKDRAGTTTNGIIGGVFGGSRMRYGGSANIYMTGGWVETGVYGGSNYTGTLEGNVNMVITGGQVGTDATHTGNVHGGGYGQPTIVNGNVDVTLGTRNTTTGVTSGSAVVYGDVYGGSALGSVNGTSKSNTLHTNVTLNAGTINGNLYGGALGSNSVAANVYAPVQVTVNGGEAKNVFGCNNVNGMPQSTVNVLMTGGEVHECVYGGGNAAPYTGDPKVKITGGTVDQSVFGGGLGSEAAITGDTRVIITGTSHVKQNVYGGGNGGSVSGQTHVDIGGE